jgi:hypothetical protein
MKMTPESTEMLQWIYDRMHEKGQSQFRNELEMIINRYMASVCTEEEYKSFNVKKFFDFSG